MSNDYNCISCFDTGVVCAHHPDKPWGGAVWTADGCDCGPPVPCEACSDEWDDEDED